MRTAVVLFTRDLRVHDNPALTEAVRRADRVVPLFVVDPAVVDRFCPPNRAAFLAAALADLDGSLRRLGGRLFVRRGDPGTAVAEVCATVDADEVWCAADVSAYARRREERMGDALAADGRRLHLSPGVTVVPPGELTPSGSDHFAVFTPYWRRWTAAGRRSVGRAPRRVVVPDSLDPGALPRAGDLSRRRPSPDLAPGGEGPARELLGRFLAAGADRYDGLHDDLAADGTSRLSPYLHFGCLSAAEVAERAAGHGPGGEALVRQLAWRDFHHQVVAARPDAAHRDYRHRGDDWETSGPEFDAWKSGLTGYPIVDAGMRQLQREGWMHNRARLITASFLTKDLYVDWRSGAAHFFELLVDGDLANNTMNWQWVAGTGTDTRPNRVLNPLRQADRYDPDGDYVRRYVPELAGVAGRAVHRPWRLGPLERAALDYPEPIVDHGDAAAAFSGRRRPSQHAGPARRHP